MNFDQKIKYLDYVEGRARVRGAGFLRVECWGNTCNLILQASGLFEMPNGSFPVTLTRRGREWHLRDLEMEHGKGRLELKGLSCEDLLDGKGEEAFPVWEAEKLTVALGGDRRLVAVLREAWDDRTKHALEKEAPEEQPRQEGAKEAPEEQPRQECAKEAPEEQPRQEGAKEAPEGKSKQECAKEAPEGKSKQECAKEASEGKSKQVCMAEPPAETSPATETSPAAKESEDNNVGRYGTGQLHAAQEDDIGHKNVAAPEQGYLATLKPGKWEQLKAIYPPIAPFGDARRFLQISPGDFVILKDRSYRMVNNSFLLHGYFTYRHLVLHRAERRGETAYYVGVPGRFYDKEKEVAILFGFESFEGATEPAGEGDFGYYMMRVEL